MEEVLEKCRLLKRQLTWLFNEHLGKKGISGFINVDYNNKVLSVEVMKLWLTKEVEKLEEKMVKENFYVATEVLGNAKGAVAVVVSILIFRNPISVTGMLGYTLTVTGVLLYNEAKKRNKH